MLSKKGNRIDVKLKQNHEQIGTVIFMAKCLKSVTNSRFAPDITSEHFTFFFRGVNSFLIRTTKGCVARNVTSQNILTCNHNYCSSLCNAQNSMARDQSSFRSVPIQLLLYDLEKGWDRLTCICPTCNPWNSASQE